MNQDPVNPLPHRIPWLTIILAILCLVALMATSDQGQEVPTMYRGQGSDVISPSVNQAETSASAPASNIAPYYGQAGVPATDTREFLKIDYRASVRTRDVQDLTKKTETVIRGYSGRVDSTSSSEKYGYVEFVIPAAKLGAFREEIESMVPARFLRVDISTQNLLPQKQNIEETQKQVEQNITALKSSRTKMVAAHTIAVRSVQSKIDSAAAEIAELQIIVTNDPARQAEVTARSNALLAELATFRTQLGSENSNYASKLASLDNQLTYASTSLDAVKNQDQNLLDNVATVHGTISFQWISVWEMVRAYLPGFWIPGILAALAVIAFLYERRRSSIL